MELPIPLLATEKLAGGPVAAADDPVRVFFDALEPILAAISDVDERLWRGESLTGDDLERFVGEIKSLSEPLGFVRLVERGGGVCYGERKFDKIPQGEVPILRGTGLNCRCELGGSGELCEVRPLAVLGAWCAECAPKILLDMRSALDRMRLGADGSEPGERVSELLRFVFHACGHHKLEVAAQFCMTLLDLFARAENEDMPADPVLQHLARSFVAAMELVFDAANAGGSADMSAVEALFQEAATATFASSSHIEGRLGLPKSFHNLLSPESVKMALTAMEAGLLFYIVRADLNSNDELANAFSGWISSGEARVISNVTVFQGDATLFDFLLASPLGETALAEAIARLDPRGTALKIEMVLKDRDAGEVDERRLFPGEEARGRGRCLQGICSSRRDVGGHAGIDWRHRHRPWCGAPCAG